MHKSISLSARLIAIALLMVVGACGGTDRNDPRRTDANLDPAPTGQPMKVVRYYWPGTYWIEIADKKGWFTEAGLNVELVDGNADYFQSLQDMADGKYDVNNFPLFDVLDFRAKGHDLFMVTNCDNSFGAEAIVALPGINSVGELKGKRVGLKVGSYLDYIFDVVAAKHGIHSEITKVDLPVEKSSVDALSAKSVDAVFIWEPIANQAAEKSGGRRIWDTSRIPGISPNGQVFHRKFIEERPGDVQAYVNVWHRTTEFIKDHPEEAFKIIADIYNVTSGDVQAFTTQDRIMDLEENITAFTYSTDFASLHGSLRNMNKFLVDNGVTDKQFDSLDVLDASFIRRAHDRAHQAHAH